MPNTPPTDSNITNPHHIKSIADFFISYNHADVQWARWIAWQLETARFNVILDEWHFQPGSNFILEMQHALERSRQTLALISPQYMSAPFPLAELAASFAKDPNGREHKLIPIRIKPYELIGLWRTIVCIDLVGLCEEEAKIELFRGICPIPRKLDSPESRVPDFNRQPMYPNSGCIAEKNTRRLFDLSIDPDHIDHFYRIMTKFDFMHRVTSNKLISRLLALFKEKSKPQEAPWKTIGGSKVRLFYCPSRDSYSKKRLLVFRTLRVSSREISPSGQELLVRLVLVNSSDMPLVVDDIHTIVYEKSATTPPGGRIGNVGEVRLMQDNSILKDRCVHSIDPTHGLELTLVLTASRYESANINLFDMKQKGGCARVLFGLFVDYYFVSFGDVKRSYVPSDCLYLLGDHLPGAKFMAIDKHVVAQIRQDKIEDRWQEIKNIHIEQLLNEHLQLRFTPRP